MRGVWSSLLALQVTPELPVSLIHMALGNQDSAEVNKRSIKDGRLQSRGPSNFHLAAETQHYRVQGCRWEKLPGYSCTDRHPVRASYSPLPPTRASQLRASPNQGEMASSGGLGRASTELGVLPILNPPPSSPPIASLWVVPVH